MPSAITLSAATRQNLLSLQATGALASTNRKLLLSCQEASATIDNPARHLTTQALVALTVLSLCLGGCSDEPSESAMRQAVTDILPLVSQYEAAEIYAKTGARRDPLSIASFRKINCVAAQPQPGHECRYEVGVNGIDMGDQKRRFVRGPGGSHVLEK